MRRTGIGIWWELEEGQRLARELRDGIGGGRPATARASCSLCHVRGKIFCCCLHIVHIVWQPLVE